MHLNQFFNLYVRSARDEFGVEESLKLGHATMPFFFLSFITTFPLLHTSTSAWYEDGRTNIISIRNIQPCIISHAFLASIRNIFYSRILSTMVLDAAL